LHVPTGLTANRGILYKNNTGTNTVKITSDDQINNMANNLHGALQLRGDNITIEHIEVDKFDKAVLAYIVENIKIGTCRCTNYVTGVYLHSVVNIHFASLHTETASIYATTSPGHSGLLYTGVENLHIAYLYIRNAGEHGVRCGGGLFQTNGVFIAIAFIIECGQCAYKIQDSTGTIPLNHVIGQLTIEDCADTSTPGANEDGLRLENCTGVTISKITVRKRGNTYSAYNGIYMNGARDVELSGQIVDTAADGIYITQDATGLGYTPQKNGNITFNGMAVHRPGVNTNCITVVALIRLDRIFWVNLDLRGQSGTGRTIVIPGVTASTGIDDWSVVQGWQENAGAGTHSIVADASIKVSLTTY
ncbi:MAG: hypothetical protein KDA17_04585, partial [Candidatus Saccharibacteria bacterium]|nr:hypothetical protein [Candidatus Saccharibacteria bacterium]